MGANETTAKKDVDDLIEFETYMANVSTICSKIKDNKIFFTAIELI